LVPASKVESLGIPVMTQSAVRRLITDRSGAVIGAEVWHYRRDRRRRLEHQKLMRRAGHSTNVAQGWADK